MVKTNQSLDVNSSIIKGAALKLRAIDNRFRQRILQYVMQHPKTSVTDIYKKLRYEQSVTSQHLAILRKHNYVIAQRDGRNIYYAANTKEIERVNGVIKNFIGV